MSAGVELLIDGDLICLACQLVDPLCEGGPIVACEVIVVIVTLLSNIG